MKNETLEQYKIRKGITCPHRLGIEISLDFLRLYSEKLKEADRILKLKNEKHVH